MKRTILLGTLLFLTILVVAPVAAQDGTYTFESDYYRVISEVDDTHARRTAEHLEAMLSLYNRQFRFAPEDLTAPLRVRIFASKDRYDAYLTRLIDETRDGFVYLHYQDIEKSELVGYNSPEGDLTQSMNHQSFVQYLRAFVPNPPLWIREGFAVYYETSQYDPEFDTAIYHENLLWLDTLKEIIAGDSVHPVIPFDEMLAMRPDDAREQLDAFYPQAWGMVSFLLNSDEPAANRILWDSLSALDADATLDENIEAVYNEAFRWADQDELVELFVGYLDSRRSFRGWITHGVDRYNASDLDEAEAAFTAAVELDEGNYVPYYYLGLINYEEGNYGLADFYYQEAITKGAEAAVTLYALGVNAYADNRFDDAVAYLEEAVEADPAYEARAEEVLVRIRG
ncbi:MAG: hypothetical protein ACLFR8_09895 [Alkalispirochaeta sp.]